MIYTDEDLAQLVNCPKTISRPPRREMKVEGAYLRNDMELESLDRKRGFRVFFRQNRDFPENFSIGMDYLPREEPGSFCLIRFNGIHGANRAHPHHLKCHVHRSTAEDVNAGIRAERQVEHTMEYAAFRDALRSFLSEVNVQAADLLRCFPGFTQVELFGEQEEA